MGHRGHVDSLLLSMQMMQKFLLSISNTYYMHVYVYMAHCYTSAIDTNILVSVIVITVDTHHR